MEIKNYRSDSKTLDTVGTQKVIVESRRGSKVETFTFYFSCPKAKHIVDLFY